MSKWLWIAPMLLVAGCSKNPSANSQAPATTASAQTAPATPTGDPQPAVTTPAAEPAAAAAENPEPVAPPPTTEAAPPPPAASAVVIPRGTPLRVRVDQSISTRRNRRGDRFSATLTDPVLVDGRDVLPRGTRLHGHVLVSAASGRFKGRARLVLALDSFERNGRRYPIDTTAASRVSGNHKKRNVVAIGGGSGIGAAIGAIAAGGSGALIGAGAGAAAGTVGEAITGKKEVTIPAETVMRFTLGAPVRV